jgi:hypothetical protein
MEKTLRNLLTEEGAEAEGIAELTGFPREELLQFDVDDVTTVTGEETVPPGARAVDITTIGAMLVSLGNSGAGLSLVMNAIREWRGRCRGTRSTLRLTLAGNSCWRRSTCSSHAIPRARREP